MKKTVELDSKGNFVDIRNIRFECKVADVLLGVQRGIDVYFRFDSHDNLINERCFHWSGQNEDPWSNEKCLEEVIKVINQGGVIKTTIGYPPKIEEPNVIN